MAGSMGICQGVCGEAVAIWRLLFMRHLRVARLLDESANAGIIRLDFRAYPLAEFCGCQMDVQTSRVGVLVSGNQRNILQAHPCPFQDGTPLMTEGMRGQRSEADLLSDSFD